MKTTVKKGLLVVLALGVLIVAGSILYLNSSHFEGVIRSLIVDSLESRFPVRVELEDVGLSLWAGGFVLDNLSISHLGTPQAPPAIEIGEVTLRFSLPSLFRLSASLDYLSLDSFRIRIIKEDNGRLNLANMFAPERKEKKEGPKAGIAPFLRLGIREFEIRDGLILYDSQPFLLESGSGKLLVNMDYFSDRQAYHGVATLTDFSLSVGGFSLPDFSTTINFRLFGNRVELPYIGIDTAAVQGRVSGAIEDLSDLVYRFRTDLIVIPPEMTRPALRNVITEGDFRLTGSVAGQKGDLVFDGELTADQWAIGRWKFGAFRTQLLVDRESVTTRNLSTRFLGGVVEAEGQLSWGEDRPSEFRVRAREVDLGRLMSRLDLQAFRLAGSAAYQGTMAWKGVRFDLFEGRGRASYRGSFSVPAVGEEDRFPLEGTADVRLDNSGAAFDNGVAQTMGGRLEYGGEFNFNGQYDVQLGMESEVDDEFVRFARLANLADLQLWQRIRFEQVATRARLTGGSGHYHLEGEVRIEELEVGEDSFGDLQTSLLLDPQVLRLSDIALRRDDQRISATFELQRGEGESEGDLSADISVDRGDIQTLMRLFGLEIPASGELTGNVRLYRPGSEELQGEGQFRIEPAEIAGQPLQMLETGIEIAGGRIEFRDLVGRLQGGRLEGHGRLDWDSREFEAAVQGSSVPLAEIRYLPEDPPLQGLADLSFEGSGTFDRPVFDVSLEIDTLTVGEEAFQNVRLIARNREGNWQNATFRLGADFQEQPLFLDGEVGLEKPYPIEASMQFDQMPLDPYLCLVVEEEGLNIQGSTSGRLNIQGSAGEPDRLKFSLDLSALRLASSGYEINSQSPVHLDYQDGRLVLEPFTLVGKDTRLEVSGRLQREAETLELRANGDINLTLFDPFLDAGNVDGLVSLEILVSGPIRNPRMLGKATVSGVSFRHPEIPTSVFDAHGELRFTRDQISIDQLTARTPLGVVGAEGGIFLEGITPVRWLVNVYGTGLRLEYPRRVFSILDVDVDLIRSETSRLISGAVYVRSAEYNENISLPELILKATSDQVVSRSSSTGTPTNLDIAVEGYRTFRIDNNLADLTASGDLNIRGTVQNPVVLGSANVDSGKLFLENNEYDIERGTINFNDPRRNRPVLNFEAQTDVRDVTVNVILHGPLDQLKFSFRSEPPLPSSAIITLLALGRTPEELLGTGGASQQQVGSLAFYGAGKILSQSLGEQLQNQSSKLFGLERVSVDPFLMGSERNPAAQVTLGKDISDRVSVTYSTVVGSEQQGYVVVVQVELTDWVTVVGSGDQSGAVAVDFKLKKRF